MPTLRGFILGLICLTAVIAAGEWYARREFEQCSALLGEAPYEWGWIPSSRNYLDPPVNASRIYPDRNQQPNRVVYDELGFRAGTRTGTSSTGGLLCLGGETCLAPRLPQRYLFTDVWNELRTRAGFNGSIRNGSAPYGCPLLWQIQFAERILPAQPDQILIILGPESLDSDFRIRRAVQFDSNSQPVACVHPAFESVSAGKSSPLKDVGIPRLLLPGLINACWNQPQSEKQLKITDRKSTLSEARVHEMLQPLMELSNRCQENHIRLRVVYLPNASELLSLENTQPATGSGSTPRQQIAQALSGSGLDYLDLLESFQKQAQENQLFTPDQGYLTSTGHRLLAEILYQKLDATTALPRSAESSGPHETSAHR